jgi:hypothetical protein
MAFSTSPPDLEECLVFNYPTAPHNGTDTSIEAAESVKEEINGMCRDILYAITTHPDGMTCDEAEVFCGMKHQTASARLRDLMQMEPALLEFHLDPSTGKALTRKTRSGRPARVYYATDYAITGDIR